MRLGLVLPVDSAVELSRSADAAGIAAVLVGSGADAIAVAAELAVVTEWTRIVVPVRLGSEHPVTLAEEVAVVDQASRGRIVVVADSGDLTADEAGEDLAIMREAWSSRWLRHEGPRWRIPAGIHGESSPRAVAVTPSPAQLEMPVWLDGPAGPDLARETGLPVLSRTPQPLASSRTRPAPVVVDVTGDLAADRAVVLDAAESGASFAFVSGVTDPEAIERYVARFLVPEGAMPDFPRIIAESAWPMAWSIPNRNE